MFRLIVAVIVAVLCLFGGQARADMSGGFNLDDISMHYSAWNQDGGAGASLWLSVPYHIEQVVTSFYTEHNDPTLFHWAVKIPIDLTRSPNEVSQLDSYGFRHDGYELDVNSWLGYGATDDSPENYASAKFCLDPATIYSAEFDWWEDPTGESNYAVGYFSVIGRLDGNMAYEFGQNFQAVPEPATICLLALGSLGLFSRRKR